MQGDFKGVWIPKEIWELTNLNITEKVTLSIINGFSEQEQGCFANNEYFANLLNLSKGRVSKVINGLVKKGYLQIEHLYKTEVRKIEKRNIKMCIECSQRELESIVINDQRYSQKRPQNTEIEVVNNQGYSRKQPYPLVVNDQDIKNIYKKIYNISSSKIFQESKIHDGEVKNKKVFKQNSDPYLLAQFLEKNISENNPKFPQSEEQRQRWAKDFDLMIRRDKIEADDIAEVIEWSQKDSFWRSNILSGKKLRDKYQQLRMRMIDK